MTNNAQTSGLAATLLPGLPEPTPAATLGATGRTGAGAPTAEPRGEGEVMQPRVPAPVIEIHVFGQPAPQGSKHGRPIYRGRGAEREFTGKVAQQESSPNLKPWREAVKHAALDVMKARHATSNPFWILNGPVFIYTVFTFVRPKTHYRTGRNAHLLRDNAPAYPIRFGRNDIEKLDRGTRDALTDAGVWVDDAQVAHHDSWKVWAREHPDALPVAGAVIRIYRLPALDITGAR